FAAAFLAVGDDHLAHGGDAFGVEEHVFGAAKADALGAKAARGAGIQRGFGVGADFHAAGLVGPAHDRGKIARHFRLHGGHGAQNDFTRAAVNGDDVTGFDHMAAHTHGVF